MALRVVCISDTHGRHDDLVVPDGDVLVHAGDFTKRGTHAQIAAFDDWLATLPHKHKLVIAGNHELSLDANWYPTAWKRWHREFQDPVVSKALLRHCTYLENETVEIDGVRFFGSPYSPVIPGAIMAFHTMSGSRAKAIWGKIPTDVDVLVTHSPPHGIRDLSVRGEHCGDEDLLEEIKTRVQPKYHVFGHIHECYGSDTFEGTTYINAASCTVQHQCTNAPIVFDIQIPK
ncbi:calcineurin-like phosphoesterase [Achlya hypogyna]|uniref:Calcineurin-like phosphoesterase n=1 Tax=Achlya hypogyna TaxID=1202772 RepID=A0A1V9ZTA0_ACHHY|nr:calcineurin-like phosphoesterase [Achlya hypogyna]